LSLGTVYVVGAGLAGLSAAVELAKGGRRVEVIEGAAQAGGRCRSYVDPQLGVVIDNGNHLVLSGNTAVMDYLAAIGASDRLAGPKEAAVAFADIRSGLRWTVRPNDGPVPWWVLAKSRGVPGAGPLDYLELTKLLRVSPDRPLGEVLKSRGQLWRRLIHPFFLAALNTDPEAGSAALAGAVFRETLAKGGAACRPRVASPTLAAAFIDPALACLEQNGASVRLGRRVRALDFASERVRKVSLSGGEIAVGPDDDVVLAVPPWAAQDLIPGLEAPDEFCAIVNGHFLHPAPAGADPIVGVIGGTAEWVFAFEDRLSVTVSGADRLLDADREDLARTLWKDVAAVHGLSGEPPPWQIVKERRAAFAATPEQNRKRPGARTRWDNLVLAGDWTQTGLPATIEGALRSGRTAAALVQDKA
jgi:squalene-associated FAD-dependent desaturase